jgi:glycosyltransferase involved in cell wall biosynthesis
MDRSRENPLVSILIPAFNAERWIEGTLRSALNQTWPRTEVIVVDDGSRDRTREVATSFASAGVKLVSQPNQGAAAARNRAFAESRGDYIQWLDADDLLGPDKIGRQLAARERPADPRTLLSAPWGQFLFRHAHARFSRTALWCDLTPVEWLVRKLGQNLHMQTATWLVSRELTEAAGPWNTRLLGDDDGEYFCRVLMQSNGVRFVPDAKVFYRSTGSQSLSYIGRSSAKIEAQFHSMRLHIGYIRSLEDSERVRSVCVKYLQTWLMNFYPERPDIVRAAEELARELGGRLETPRFSWKYAWVGAVAGPELAKRTQVLSRHVKWSLLRSWDQLLARVEGVPATLAFRKH